MSPASGMATRLTGLLPLVCSAGWLLTVHKGVLLPHWNCGLGFISECPRGLLCFPGETGQNGMARPCPWMGILGIMVPAQLMDDQVWGGGADPKASVVEGGQLGRTDLARDRF